MCALSPLCALSAPPPPATPRRSARHGLRSAWPVNLHLSTLLSLVVPSPRALSLSLPSPRALSLSLFPLTPNPHPSPQWVLNQLPPSAAAAVIVGLRSLPSPPPPPLTVRVGSGRSAGSSVPPAKPAGGDEDVSTGARRPAEAEAEADMWPRMVRVRRRDRERVAAAVGKDGLAVYVDGRDGRVWGMAVVRDRGLLVARGAEVRPRAAA
jgi:hypothetical protein